MTKVTEQMFFVPHSYKGNTTVSGPFDRIPRSPSFHTPFNLLLRKDKLGVDFTELSLFFFRHDTHMLAYYAHGFFPFRCPRHSGKEITIRLNICLGTISSNIQNSRAFALIPLVRAMPRLVSSYPTPGDSANYHPLTSLPSGTDAEASLSPTLKRQPNEVPNYPLNSLTLLRVCASGLENKINKIRPGQHNNPPGSALPPDH